MTDLATDCVTGRDYVVAAVISTEVPPIPVGDFTIDMIPAALRAVCDVIRNRVASPLFPKTPVEVVLQRGQFSAVCQQDYWRNAMAGVWFPAHVAGALAAWREPTWPHFDARMCWYYSPVSMVPPYREPTWVSGRTEVLIPGLSRDYFRFYKETE